jgi:2-iminobutanoate/2-iminopropanoate deaminase
MEEKKAFHTDKAAVTGGPYSQAIIHKGVIYVSGQGAMTPDTNELKLGSIEEEAELAMTNLRIILEEAGSSIDKLLTITVYLKNMQDYGSFNEVYKSFFSRDLPARTCIQAGDLPFGTRVEITATAHL